MTTPKPTGRGGAGRGQGRKPLSPGEPTAHASVRLTEAHLEQLRRIGGGNLSEGIRRLLDERRVAGTVAAKAPSE